MSYLHEHNYRLKVTRPWPLNQDEELRHAFYDKLQRWQADPVVDLWFCDEAGIEGDPCPRRAWTKIGKTRTSIREPEAKTARRKRRITNLA